MQAENAVISRTLPTTENARPVLPLLPLLLVSAPELPALLPGVDPLAVAFEVVVVVVPRFATAGVCEPPQPAVAIPRAATVTARASFVTNA